jgi:hypothetical protein
MDRVQAVSLRRLQVSVRRLSREELPTSFAGAVALPLRIETAQAYTIYTCGLLREVDNNAYDQSLLIWLNCCREEQIAMKRIWPYYAALPREFAITA